jgi:octaprenyl-diphosphate synthase
MLGSVVASDVAVASDLSLHLFSAGGKRVRPALVILSALACGGSEDDRVISLAAATELVHSASLLHDDVVDETSARRGVATANAMWGNKLSVLGGDLLLSKAFSLLAGIGNSEILSALSATAVLMSESEMLQAASEGSIESWREYYWRIIRGKTASLTGSCCECGAILRGASPATRRALAGYGHTFGLAFQITDDLLDITGDPARTGKDIGTDLIHGKFTLPVLLAAERRPELLELVGSGLCTCEEAERIAAIVLESGAADEARRKAVEYGEEACRQLGEIPHSDYRSALEALAVSVIDREV